MIKKTPPNTRKNFQGKRSKNRGKERRKKPEENKLKNKIIFIKALRKHNLHIQVMLAENNSPASFMIDTGADVCLLSRKHTSLCNIQPDDTIICAASPEFQLKNYGQKCVEFFINGEKFRQNFKICEGLSSDAILGMNFCLRNNVLINCTNTVSYTHLTLPTIYSV